MKVVVLVLTGLLGSGPNLSGQTSDSSPLPEGVSVQFFEFRPISKEGEAQKVWIPPDSTDPGAYEGRTRGGRPGSDSSVSTLESEPKQERAGFEVYLQLKNSGSRAIKKLAWDFLFLDAESRSELKRFTITSKHRIAPGEIKILSKQVLPALFLGNKSRPDFARGKPVVVIRHVQFADGSKWQTTKIR